MESTVSTIATATRDLLLLALCLACVPHPAFAVGDPFGWHHSPSTQITPAPRR